MPQFWGGFVGDKLATHEVDSGFGGWGSEKHRSPAIFTSKAEARRHYVDVRKIEVRTVRRQPRRTA